MKPQNVGPTVIGQPILADEHRGVGVRGAVVVERDELERLAQVDVASPVEPRLFRILIPREIEVEVADGAEHDIVAAVR